EAPSNLIIVGKVIITPEVFKELRRLKPVGGEIRMADALKNLLKRRPIYGLRFQGSRYDCGNKLGFLKATVEFALKHPEVKDGFRQYIKERIKKI
ncbi:MAG: UTP--glucose-1-phosphate uridylyltransferase, partial [bacterium]|nr:UTP--glucose-1-phosphate uridylyltransferase [bacterium]